MEVRFGRGAARLWLLYEYGAGGSQAEECIQGEGVEVGRLLSTFRGAEEERGRMAAAENYLLK